MPVGRFGIFTGGCRHVGSGSRQGQITGSSPFGNLDIFAMGDWDERNWDAVRRQEQKKQEILVKASKNSEKIRQMVRQVEETKALGAETLNELDKQSGDTP